MTYYIKKDDRVAIFGDDLENLEKSVLLMPWLQGLTIEQTAEGEVIYGDEILTIEEAQQKEAQKQREEINALSLTKREVFLAVYKDKGITPEEIRAMIKNPEALIEFDYANEYFRGNPLIEQLGLALGYTSDELDYLFENGELPEKGEMDNIGEV